MLNKQQIEIADHILKYLEKSGGKSSTDDYPDELRNKGFDRFESSFTIDYLIEHSELIDNWKTDRWIRLTPKGYKAVKIGIEQYFKDVESGKQLELDSLSATIDGVETAKKTSKTSKIISIIAIVAAIIIPFSIEIFKNVIKEPSDTNANGQNRIEVGHSNIPLKLTDALYIEVLKDSLKHDTLFINEIKDLINKKE